MDPLLRIRSSGWLRQSRFRAKKLERIVDATLEDIIEIYEQYDNKCAYCGDNADSPDHPFPINSGGDCIPANIVPCCNKCRKNKKLGTIIDLYKNNHIDQSNLSSILKTMHKKRNGHKIREYLKKFGIIK